MQEEGETLLRRKTRWRIGKWTFFAVIAASIVLALTSAVSRLQNTVDMIDAGTAGSSEYNRMSQRATMRTMLGLGIGCAGMLGYLVCFVMHQRADRSLKDWQDSQRRAELAELGAEEGDP